MASIELLLLNLIMGLLSSFSPCLFPLLPSYVAMTLRSNHSRLKIFLSSLFLISGLMVVFLSIGAISNLIGGFLLKNYALFAKIQGGILIIAGLLMIKTPGFIYEITLPDRLENWLYDENRSENRPYIFSFVLGLLFTIIATPCAAGFFLTVWGTLIGEAFGSQVLLVLAFSLGAGLPFMIMSLFLPQVRGDLINKMHSANSKISFVLGIFLVIIGIILIVDLLPTNTLLF